MSPIENKQHARPGEVSCQCARVVEGDSCAPGQIRRPSLGSCRAADLVDADKYVRQRPRGDCHGSYSQIPQLVLENRGLGVVEDYKVGTECRNFLEVAVLPASHARQILNRRWISTVIGNSDHPVKSSDAVKNLGK